MRNESMFIAVILARLLGLLTACAGPAAREPAASDGGAASYLGQPVPDTTAVLFAPGLVSTDAVELNAVFSPDWREFYFTREVDSVFTLLRSVLGDSGWSTPRPLSLFPNGDEASGADMSLSQDGSELFFLGQYPKPPVAGDAGLDLWRSRRSGTEWATAERVPAPVSTNAEEVYPMVVADGSLYFSSDRPGGLGANDLYRAQRLPGGGFAAPVNVGAPVNTEAGEGDVFVAPDESYLIVSARRPNALGNGDLYLSFRTQDGTWTAPVNLGPSVNSAVHEYCPMVTPDGKYLFFSRQEPGATPADPVRGDVYWVDARVIERLRPAPG